MPDINIAIKDKTPIYGDISIVCDNSDYMVHWTLDEEWSEYDTKTMRTIYMDGTYTDTVFSGSEVALPVVTVPGAVQIGLFAGDIRTSRVAILRALPSVRSAAGAPADPASSVYEQLLAALNDKVPKDQSAENAGKVLGIGDDGIVKPVAGGTGGGGTTDHSQLINRDKADQHPMSAITGLESALEDKQAKGDYITADDLQDATDAALAQAKANREFDGAQGPKGDTGAQGERGPQGAQGPAGAGMDITGAAAGQIPVITAVDADGKPTAWGAADMPGGTDLNAVQVYVADFANDEMTVTAGAVDKYARVVVS